MLIEESGPSEGSKSIPEKSTPVLLNCASATTSLTNVMFVSLSMKFAVSPPNSAQPASPIDFEFSISTFDAPAPSDQDVAPQLLNEKRRLTMTSETEPNTKANPAQPFNLQPSVLFAASTSCTNTWLAVPAGMPAGDWIPSTSPER